MSPTSTDRITLTGSQRRALTRLIRAGRTEQRLVTRAEIVLAAAEGQSERADRTVAAGVRGHRAQVASPLVRGTGGGVAGRCATIRPAHRCSPRCRSPRSRRWPARHRPMPGCRCRGGRARSWRATPSPRGSARPSRRRRCAGGCPRTPSNPGSTGRGSSSPIPTSPPRPTACSTSTTGCGTGKPLGGNDYVISADEKTSIQARCRCHPTLPPGKSRAMRVNHDYDRGGAVAYLAAYDVHRGQGVRPLRGHHRHRTVQPPRRPGHDRSTLRIRRSGVLDRRQRLLPPRPSRDRPARQAVPQRDHGAHPGARLLAEPDRDLLLHRPTESRLAQRLHRPRRGHRPPHPASRPATTRPRDRSNGSSPPPTSTELLTRLDNHQPEHNPTQPRAA